MKIVAFVLAVIITAIFGTYFFVDMTHILVFENEFTKGVMVGLVFFTIFNIIRYLLFILFSLLKIMQKTVDYDLDDPDYRPKVTIIVPAYNEDVTISTTIKSILNQTYSNLEIIIIDDGSSDDTYKISKKFEGKYKGKTIRVLTKKNGGKSRALNFAIERSKGEFIMCVDADSKLKEDAVALMVRYFKNPEIGAVAGSVFVSNRVNIITKLQALEYIEGLNMARNAQAFLKMVNIIPGPIGMFRKKEILEVGGYMHDTYAEDADLTLRIIKKNFKIEFEPDAIAWTEAPDNLLDLIKQRYRWTRGIVQAIRKHSDSLFKFEKGSYHFNIIIWYMFFESVFLPFLDFFTIVFILYIFIAQGLNPVFFYLWSLFTLMEIVAALYTVLMINEKKRCALYSLLYRLYFSGVLNIAKVFSIVEEFFQIEMSWGKLNRKGGI